MLDVNCDSSSSLMSGDAFICQSGPHAGTDGHNGAFQWYLYRLSGTHQTIGAWEYCDGMYMKTDGLKYVELPGGYSGTVGQVGAFVCHWAVGPDWSTEWDGACCDYHFALPTELDLFHTCVGGSSLTSISVYQGGIFEIDVRRISSYKYWSFGA